MKKTKNKKKRKKINKNENKRKDDARYVQVAEKYNKNKKRHTDTSVIKRLTRKKLLSSYILMLYYRCWDGRRKRKIEDNFFSGERTEGLNYASGFIYLFWENTFIYYFGNKRKVSSYISYTRFRRGDMLELKITHTHTHTHTRKIES